MEDYIEIERRLNIITQQDLIRKTEALREQLNLHTAAINAVLLSVVLVVGAIVYNTYEIERIRDAVGISKGHLPSRYRRNKEQDRQPNRLLS